MAKNIISIAGGKGGTGKSFLTANLGVALSLLDQRVIIIDADFGGPNLHFFTSVKKPKKSLSSFFVTEVFELDELLTDTGIENLKLIPCGSRVYGTAHMPYYQKISLLKKINNLDADYILLDISAGSNFNTLDFFNISNNGILVINPNMSSRTNAMVFIKSALYRKIIDTVRQNKKIWEEIQKEIKKKKKEAFDINTILTWVVLHSRDMVKSLQNLLVRYRPNFIFNMVKEEHVSSSAEKIIKATRNHLQIDMNYLGRIHYDDSARHSDNLDNFFTIKHEDSKVVHDLYEIASSFVDENNISFRQFHNSLKNLSENHE